MDIDTTASALALAARVFMSLTATMATLTPRSIGESSVARTSDGDLSGRWEFPMRSDQRTPSFSRWPTTIKARPTVIS